MFSSFFQVNKTAADDNKFRLATEPTWLNDCVIFIESNDAKMGDTNNQEATMNIGDVYTFNAPVNIEDIFFKNATAGSNTKVIINGTNMTQAQVTKYLEGR